MGGLVAGAGMCRSGAVQVLLNDRRHRIPCSYHLLTAHQQHQGGCGASVRIGNSSIGMATVKRSSTTSHARLPCTSNYMQHSFLVVEIAAARD